MYEIVPLTCQITLLLIFSLFVKIFRVLALHSMGIPKVAQVPESVAEFVFYICIPKLGLSCGTWKYFSAPQS